MSESIGNLSPSSSSAAVPTPEAGDPTLFENKQHRSGASNRLLGIGFVLWMLVLAYFGCLYMMSLFLPLLWLSPRLYRTIMDGCGLWWFHVTVFFHQYLFGIRFVHTGDAVLPSDRQVLYVANHRTRLDWMFLWNWFWFQRRLINEKIILKWELRYMGPWGWAMQFLNFVFLKRTDKDFDMANLHDHFRAWADQHYPAQLLVFPEGTDLDRGTMARGHRFARQQGRPLLRHTLYPRHGAFQAALADLTQLDAVYDITLGYPDVCPQNEKSLLVGDMPHEIHVHVRRYPAPELAASSVDAQEAWLNAVWKDKEDRLRAFYEDKTNFDGSQRQGPAENYLKRPADLHYRCLFFVGLQIAFVLFMITLHCLFPIACIPTVALTAFFIIYGPLGGGIDALEQRALGRTSALDILAQRKQKTIPIPTKTD